MLCHEDPSEVRVLDLLIHLVPRDRVDRLVLDPVIIALAEQHQASRGILVAEANPGKPAQPIPLLEGPIKRGVEVGEAPTIADMIGGIEDGDGVHKG